VAEKCAAAVAAAAATVQGVEHLMVDAHRIAASSSTARAIALAFAAHTPAALWHAEISTSQPMLLKPVPL